MMPSYSVDVTAADGTALEVPLGKSKIEAESGPVKVMYFQFAPWKMEKGNGLAFSFGLQFAKGAVPESVLLEDATEAPIFTLFSDAAPTVNAQGRWMCVSKPYAPVDEHVNWIMSLDNGVRVFRITVKVKDDKAYTLYVPIFVPAQSKGFIRTQLGVTS